MDRDEGAGTFNCLLYVAFSVLYLSGCSRKQPEPPPPQEPLPILSETPAPEPPADGLDTAAFAPESPPEIVSTPPREAFLGHSFNYGPALSRHILDITWRLDQAPAGMRLESGALHWTPDREGRFTVRISALADEWSRLPGDGWPSQSFHVIVRRLPEIRLAPLPYPVTAGRPVRFDLGPSGYPKWAWPDLRVRFDFDGDGVWDLPYAPFASSRVKEHVYAQPGHYRPRIQAIYRSSEERLANAEIRVVVAPLAALSLPDTVEPGDTLAWDASGSKGEGPLAYRLDVQGDGVWDAVDSAQGRFRLPAPPSGSHKAVLEVRDGNGLSSRTERAYVANAAPRIRIKLDRGKADLVTEVGLRMRALDPDDGFVELRVNLTGAEDGWQSVSPGRDSAADGGRLAMDWKKAYGRPGKYAPRVCALSRDGRRACAEAEVEIYDAPPSCDAGKAGRATLGVPLALDPEGRDPDGRIVLWEWDLNGDGAFEFASKENGRLRYTFSREGRFVLTLRVTSSDGRIAEAKKTVEVRKKWKG